MTIILAFLAAVASPGAAAQCAAGDDQAAISCRALAFQDARQFAQAAQAFEQLAAILPPNDPKRDRALAAAGNMWIAADEAGRAAAALDKALAGSGLRAEQRGEALLDRARAAEAQDDLKTARARLAEAGTMIGDQAFYHYFSAALAIREGDLAVARSAINRALAIAPSDPLVTFEAGHVALAEGNEQAARAYWQRTVQTDPGGPAGIAAKDALRLLASPPAVESARPAP